VGVEMEVGRWKCKKIEAHPSSWDQKGIVYSKQ
jgi:hypothetical protein